MPQVTVYVRDEDLSKWKAVQRKSEFLSNALNGLSSNGRTADFDSANLGSNPSEPAKKNSGASPAIVENKTPAILPKDTTAVVSGDWKSAGERKAVVTPPCCFLPKQCPHDIWNMDTGECINPKTGVVKEV